MRTRHKIIDILYDLGYHVTWGPERLRTGKWQKDVGPPLWTATVKNLETKRTFTLNCFDTMTDIVKNRKECHIDSYDDTELALHYGPAIDQNRKLKDK